MQFSFRSTRQGPNFHGGGKFARLTVSPKIQAVERFGTKSDAKISIDRTGKNEFERWVD
jgi:hypothetical protein